MLLYILNSIISLGIMVICLYFAIIIDAKYCAVIQKDTVGKELFKVALHKAAPLTGACIMAIKAVHFPVGYLMALAVFVCLFLYEIIRLKVLANR